MKTLLAILFSITSSFAWAGGPHGHGHRHHHGHNHWHWVAPALISGAVVYSLTRPTPPPPVYYVQQPSVLPPPPYGYQYQQILDANCNCYRYVLIPG